MKDYVITIKYYKYKAPWWNGRGYWEKGSYIPATATLTWDELKAEVDNGLRYTILEKHEGGMTIESKGYYGKKAV